MIKDKIHHRTEGPWSLKKRGWMGGGPFVIGRRQRVVADCGLESEDGSYRRIENVANAKFISKSPEMLDLLHEARLLLEHNRVSFSNENGELIDGEKWIAKFNKLLGKIREAN